MVLRQGGLLKENGLSLERSFKTDGPKTGGLPKEDGLSLERSFKTDGPKTGGLLKEDGLSLERSLKTDGPKARWSPKRGWFLIRAFSQDSFCCTQNNHA
jgi:hypothetical protein